MTLIGNGLSQSIYGNEGLNTLSGRGGDDLIFGGGGNDTLNGDDGIDRLYGGTGNDQIFGGIGDDQLYGEVGNDSLSGGDGSDRLEGGVGADTTSGGLGDDRHYVDNSSDVVVEARGQGTDTVYTTASLALSLTSEVEALRTADAAGVVAINLSGSEHVNSVYGNAGANVINGRGGVDQLWGYGGNDTFVFNSIAEAGDRIADMGLGNDIIQMDNAGFGSNVGTGSLTAAGVTFEIGTRATTANETLFYNQTTDRLYWDFDGSGAGAAIQLAFIANGAAITADDFIFV
jgi:Ca2+-binding RTX toxin-like protein